MKKQISKPIFLLLSLMIFLSLLMGCSSIEFKDETEKAIKEGVRKAGDSATALIGEGALTDSTSLKGERNFGADEYVGTYQADYNNFSGTEILFGGASLERKTDDTLQIKGNIETQSGEMKVYWNSGNSEPKMLFKEPGEHSTTIQLKGGWEYLSIEGQKYDGDIQLEIK